METRLTVPPEAEGERADRFLSTAMDITRAAAQKWLEQGYVTVNGRALTKSARLSAHTELTVVPPELKPCEAKAQDIPLDIVYEDAALLVVNKPKGMVVHPAAGNPDGTLVNALLAHCPEGLSGINGVMRPGIVHRIDKDTSGILAVAKTNEAHLSLAEQIKEHSVTRAYYCIAYGKFKETEFTVDKAIDRHPKDRKKMAVCTTGGRHAITHVTVLRQYNDCALVRCRLETGRTHQIRVHLSSLGHPVAGDPVYGLKTDKIARKYGLCGQMLHAAMLGFIHPKTAKYVEFSAPPPDYFLQVVRDLDLSAGCEPFIF